MSAKVVVRRHGVGLAVGSHRLGSGGRGDVLPFMPVPLVSSGLLAEAGHACRG